MKFYMLMAGLVFSNSVYAAKGSFYCETNEGTAVYDGIYVSGNLDGEAQVTDLVVNYAEGDGLESPLEIVEINLLDGFELVAMDTEKKVLITINGQNSKGNSIMNFEFHTKDSVVARQGQCTVDFEAGI